MDYRFLRLASIYPAALEGFVRDNPASETLSYDELFTRLVAVPIGQGDAFSRHLSDLGREAKDIFVNAWPLQQAWAREHGLDHSEEDWLATAIAQIRDFQPDVIYLDDLYLFDQRTRSRLRASTSPTTLIAGWRAAPTMDFTEFRDLDVVFSAGQNFIDRLTSAGVRARLLPLAFDPPDEVSDISDRDLDVTFVGSVGRSMDSSFSKRRRLVEYLLTKTPIEVWDATPYPQVTNLDKFIYRANLLASGMGAGPDLRRRVPLLRRGWAWKGDPSAPSLKSLFPDRVHSAAFGGEYLALLGRSKITVNLHTEAAENFGGNLRMYEATGMGACLVTDWKDNMPDLFEPGREIETFGSEEECVTKIHQLLEDQDTLEKIAEAGRKRTLGSHTWRHRMQALDGYLVEMLRSPGMG